MSTAFVGAEHRIDAHRIDAHPMGQHMTKSASSRRRSFGRANLLVAVIAPLIVSLVSLQLPHAPVMILAVSEDVLLVAVDGLQRRRAGEEHGYSREEVRGAFECCAGPNKQS